jgi:hypothetical protein
MGVKSFPLAPGQRLLVDFSHNRGRAIVELDRSGEIVIWNDLCRHRGGPLHLCYRDSRGVRRCPWHDRPVGTRVPSDLVAAVFRQTSRTITLVADDGGSSPWPVRYLSPDREVGAGAAGTHARGTDCAHPDAPSRRSGPRAASG